MESTSGTGSIRRCSGNGSGSISGSKCNSVGSGSSRVVVVLVVVMLVILMVEIWSFPESLHSRSTAEILRNVGTIAVLNWYHYHHWTIPSQLAPMVFLQKNPQQPWRIIPISKWLGSPPFRNHRVLPIWKGKILQAPGRQDHGCHVSRQPESAATSWPAEPSPRTYAHEGRWDQVTGHSQPKKNCLVTDFWEEVQNEMELVYPVVNQHGWLESHHI